MGFFLQMAIHMLQRNPLELMFLMIVIGYAGGIPGPVYLTRKENERGIHRLREKVPQSQEIDQRLSTKVCLL